MLLLIPLDGCADGFIKRGCMEAKRLLNGVGIDNLRFSILVKHFDHPINERIKKAKGLDSQLGKSLNVYRLADQLRHIALRDNRSNNRDMPDPSEGFVTFSQQRQTSR